MNATLNKEYYLARIYGIAAYTSTLIRLITDRHFQLKYPRMHPVTRTRMETELEVLMEEFYRTER